MNYVSKSNLIIGKSRRINIYVRFIAHKLIVRFSLIVYKHAS